jgi:DNA-binding HxlR family transcriptional regulator
VINAAIEVLGALWSMLVVRDVIFGNRRHFRELLEGVGSACSPTGRRNPGPGSQLRP